MQRYLKSSSCEVLSRKPVSKVGGMAGTGALVLALLAGMVFSSSVLAESEKKQSMMEDAYSLNDESMLGRYGDENDEYIANASVSVSSKPMTARSKQTSSKKGEGKLGAYSLKDGAREGFYGDGVYSVSEE